MIEFIKKLLQKQFWSTLRTRHAEWLKYLFWHI